eukprot:PhM_4_TR15203/c0_g1_i1/m.52379
MVPLLSRSTSSKRTATSSLDGRGACAAVQVLNMRSSSSWRSTVPLLSASTRSKHCCETLLKRSVSPRRRSTSTVEDASPDMLRMARFFRSEGTSAIRRTTRDPPSFVLISTGTSSPAKTSFIAAMNSGLARVWRPFTDTMISPGMTFAFWAELPSFTTCTASDVFTSKPITPRTRGGSHVLLCSSTASATTIEKHTAQTISRLGHSDTLWWVRASGKTSTPHIGHGSALTGSGAASAAVTAAAAPSTAPCSLRCAGNSLRSIDLPQWLHVSERIAHTFMWCWTSVRATWPLQWGHAAGRFAHSFERCTVASSYAVIGPAAHLEHFTMRLAQFGMCSSSKKRLQWGHSTCALGSILRTVEFIFVSFECLINKVQKL